MMTMKCEQPLDEYTVQGLLLYHNPNFKYFTLCSWDGITDIQTDGKTDLQTDDPISRYLRRTLPAGALKLKKWGGKLHTKAPKANVNNEVW